MHANSSSRSKCLQLGFAFAFVTPLSGCYVLDFFQKKQNDRSPASEGLFAGVVVGTPLGPRAGSLDEALLVSVHAVPASHPPAAIRPDPDVYIRRLLLQYRQEGVVVARQIGAIEPFRLLLGGATQDFSKVPQEEYDATSLLAVFKVAEEVCKALVAPIKDAHPGWTTILPYAPENVNANLSWLAQRFIGLPIQMIDPSVVPAIVNIMNLEGPALANTSWALSNPYAVYVPACATLALDAEALYL